MDSNLVKRIAFAAVAIPLAIGVVWLGGWPLAALVSVVALLGVRELFDLAEKQGNLPLRSSGMVLAFAFPLAVQAALSVPAFAEWIARNGIYLAGCWVVAWLLELVRVRRVDQRPLGAIGVTVFGVAYAAMLPSFLLWIRHAQHGTRSWAGVAMVFFPLVVVWVCDSAAMFGGKAFGGPKLAPNISPGKTRSGGVAGLVGGVLVAPVFALWIFPAAGLGVVLSGAMLMALVLSIVGQLGDLAESLFKREAGVKDSSNLIPGHGGVLDRFDALYVTLPVAAALYAWLGLL